MDTVKIQIDGLELDWPFPLPRIDQQINTYNQPGQSHTVTDIEYTYHPNGTQSSFFVIIRTKKN